MSLPKDAEQKIQELQKLEQSVQSFAQQKQQFQVQLNELNSATEEVGKSETSYKIIGNIMVKRDAKDLSKELVEKKEMVELRITALEKQENKMKEKASELQAEVMKAIEKAEKSD